MFYIRKFNPEIHHRRSVRLRGYDYTQPGFYFITINTAGIDNIVFGDIKGGKMIVNRFGEIVKEEWLKTPIIRPNVELDEFIVMPDHFHAIIKLSQRVQLVWATCQVAHTSTNQVSHTSTNQIAHTERPHGPKPGSIGAIIAQFKMQTTKQINQSSGMKRGTIWQRSFYDRIIRTNKDLEMVREYIRNNPKLMKGNIQRLVNNL